MKKIALFSFLMMLYFVANSCASKKDAAVEITSESQMENSDSLFASLERGFCYGTCPVYKIEIYNSGYATFVGKANTEMIGTYSTRFTKQQLNSLTTVANEINYMSLDDKYDSPVTDLPNNKTSIVINGKRKEVLRRHNYPPSILTFEKQFDELIKEAKWVKLSDSQEYR